METKVECPGNQWQVSTLVAEALMSYNQHDTFTKVKLLNQTMVLTIPLGTVEHVGDIIHHQLDKHDIELIDAFNGYNVTTLRLRHNF